MIGAKKDCILLWPFYWLFLNKFSCWCWRVCVSARGAAGPTPARRAVQSNCQTESPGQEGGALQQGSAEALQQTAYQPTNLWPTNKPTNQQSKLNIKLNYHIIFWRIFKPYLYYLLFLASSKLNKNTEYYYFQKEMTSMYLSQFLLDTFEKAENLPVIVWEDFSVEAMTAALSIWWMLKLTFLTFSPAFLWTLILILEV